MVPFRKKWSPPVERENLSLKCLTILRNSCKLTLREQTLKENLK